jgi:hypothetical protein
VGFDHNERCRREAITKHAAVFTMKMLHDKRFIPGGCASSGLRGGSEIASLEWDYKDDTFGALCKGI